MLPYHLLASEYFEGDIELNATQRAILNAPVGSGYALTKRGVYTHWPFNKPIPYHIDDVYEQSRYSELNTCFFISIALISISMLRNGKKLSIC